MYVHTYMYMYLCTYIYKHMHVHIYMCVYTLYKIHIQVYTRMASIIPHETPQPAQETLLWTHTNVLVCICLYAQYITKIYTHI